MSSDEELAASEPLTASRPQRPRNRLVLGTYCVEAGIASTAVGAWASSGLSGSPRAAAWIGVTAILVVAAAWLAEPTVSLLTQYLQVAAPRRDPRPRQSTDEDASS